MSVLPNHERLLDLLILQSTQGLSDTEAAELREQLRAHPELSQDELDSAVAAILLASAPEEDPMPVHLKTKILASLPAQSGGSSNDISMPGRQSFLRSAAAGWWSAAACLVIAIAGWWPRIVGERVEPKTEIVALTPEQQRAALLSSGHAIQASWSPAGAATPAELAGDVVFDPVTQRGYLRFRGIPANDPRLEQYQLWIADGGRTLPEPVDGGVFNTPQTTAVGDVIIPFEAKLPVGKPAAFVVTVERPGGVVVSRQERVLAIAKVQGG